MPASHVRQLFALQPSRQDHLPALRIAASVAVPLVVLLLLGRTDLTIYAAFGAFTSIYARHEPLRERLTRQTQAGLLVVVSVLIGALLSWSAAAEAAVLGVTALVATFGAMISAMLSLKPAGSLFFIFASGAVGSLGPDAVAHPLLALGIAAGSAAFSVLLAWLWQLLGEGANDAMTPVIRQRLTRAQLLSHGGRFLVATVAAAALSVLVGLSHNYWAQVAAAAPIAAPTHLARLQRGVHRMVGTIAGVGVAAFVLSMPLEPWHMVVYVVVFQFLAELFVGRNYSLALLFITPLALLMTQLAHPVEVVSLLEARAVETVLGALCGLAVVYLWRTREERAADTAAVPMIRQAVHDDDLGPEQNRRVIRTEPPAPQGAPTAQDAPPAGGPAATAATGRSAPGRPAPWVRPGSPTETGAATAQGRDRGADPADGHPDGPEDGRSA